MLFGVLLFVSPSAGIPALIALIAAYAFVTGAVLIAIGFRVHHVLPTSPAAPASHA